MKVISRLARVPSSARRRLALSESLFAIPSAASTSPASSAPARFSSRASQAPSLPPPGLRASYSGRAQAAALEARPAGGVAFSVARFSSRAAEAATWRSLEEGDAAEDALRQGEKEVGGRPVYLDNQATTVQDPRVTDAMLPFVYDKFGNPHSSSHSMGWEAAEAVERARSQVAQLLGLDASRSREIIFTSGATESNNLALKGAVHYYCRAHPIAFRKSEAGVQPRVRNHIITTQLEHKCALQCCRMLQLQHKETGGAAGCDLTVLPVKLDGLVDLDELEGAIRPETLLVSVMFVNNEIGVVQDLEKIGEICKKHDVLFHTDAAQGAGKIPIDVDKMGVDLLSLSGHKIYGPKGIGALFVRAKKPRVRLQPIIDGGGQERGLRSGTLATPLCVGLGAACELALSEMENDRRHVTRLAQLLLDSVREQVPDIEVNGSLTSRYPGNLNISFTFVEGESVLMSIRDVAISSGSACTSASLEPSYVLRALGVGEEVAHTSLRFGIGRFTREEDVRQCVERLVAQVHRLRELSPLYELEMAKRRAQASGVCPNDETEGLIWT
ncbi:aminotransferase, class V superfamily protein [Besnoitia besnoiti]|uniref:cysteine desulfurase n=1 Tax=Besnoitia besnoiti TaxID=94643 RepID=A0A2A9M8T8_BESBE|nr:aminotransferase, class V superfamily protein [Besnoitia besnoiti]PFH32316.1 aminotransferase, class V superfamily protein [Besnoitia besnoiti]